MKPVYDGMNPSRNGMEPGWMWRGLLLGRESVNPRRGETRISRIPEDAAWRWRWPRDELAVPDAGVLRIGFSLAEPPATQEDSNDFTWLPGFNEVSPVSWWPVS
jgi:hypothetical protein